MRVVPEEDDGEPGSAFGLLELLLRIRDVLLERAVLARSKTVYLDPGIGFAKSAAQSLTLLRHLSALVRTGYPVFVGASRKSFIGQTLGLTTPDERLPGSLAAAASAYHHGAAALRVHDVAATRQLVDLLSAISTAQ